MTRPRLTHVLALAATIAACVGASGCKSGQMSRENDELRRQVLDLQNENEQLQRRVAELTAEVQKESQRPDSIPADIRESTPHVADITIGRLSHARDTDDDGMPDQLLVYIDPVDGLGRFVQMVGRLSVQAIYVPPDADAITLGRIALDPGQLRDAYRSSMTGTHYTIELPIEIDKALLTQKCLVQARYEDGYTGAVVTAERQIALAP